MDLILKFFPNFWPKNPFFFFLNSAPACFFGPKCPFFFFFWELVNFRPLNSMFIRISAQKRPFFVLKLSPSLFLGQFLAFNLNVYQNFCPKKTFFVLKLSRSLFFWPKKSFFSLKLLNFWTWFSNFFPIFGPKNLFFLLKLSPSLFFLAKKVLFSFKIT